MFFDMYKYDYFFFFYYFIFLFFFVSLLVLIALTLSRKALDVEKFSSYECGFEPFEVLASFNIHFYMVGISFLIFDLEIIYLYP